MSRNLGRTNCVLCSGHVILVGEIHSITEQEAGRYFAEYTGMLVAPAECAICGACYLAWIEPSSGEEQGKVFDLSYRSTFNDEPGAADLPVWFVSQFGNRLAPIDDASAVMLWSWLDKNGFEIWRRRRDEAADKYEPTLGATLDRYRLALRAVLLFHSPSPWDGSKQAKWESVTGQREATTKALCDMIQHVLGEEGREE